MSIDERPAIVEERIRAGDWELDTMIGKNYKQAIVTMAERAQQLTYSCKVETKDAKSVEDAIVKTIMKTGLPVLTLTADNGRELSIHENTARRLKADVYFAHTYSSWERGANENSNGLVRQYFPKGSDFTAIETKDLRRVERRLNNRPRKCLGMNTPNEVVFGLHPTVALGI